MKIHFDKKLLKYSIYVTLTAIAIFIALTIMSNLGTIFTSIFSIIGSGLSLVKPLLIAILIAYLLFPLTRSIENFLRTNIINDISSYLNSNSFTTSSIESTLRNLNISFIDKLEPYIIQIVDTVQKYIINNLGLMTSNIMSIGSSIATFFIAIIISIYILKDSEYFIGLWKKLYYLVFRDTTAGKKCSEVFSIINDVFSKFIRGQLLEGFCVGALSAIALSIAGIDYAVVIGIISGICNMIPYVGPIVGTILAAVMGLLSGSPIKALYAIIAMLVVQQIDNNFLAPKIVGQSVGLHAVFTMLAILIGGNIGGLIGMLIAVPIAASIRVIFNNWYDNYTSTRTN